MEGTAQIRIASRSVFGGVEDVIRMEGTATVEKTDYGWHLQYEAVNCEDEKSAIHDIHLSDPVWIPDRCRSALSQISTLSG